MHNDNDFQTSITLLAENSRQLRDDFKDANIEVKTELKEIKQLVHKILSVSEKHTMEIETIKKQLEVDEIKINDLDVRVAKIEQAFTALKTAKWILGGLKHIAYVALIITILFFGKELPEWLHSLKDLAK